jgi:hypothetical protein
MFGPIGIIETSLHMTSADTFHFHQWIPGMTGSDFCRICHKTKEQLVNERLEKAEESIEQLTINIQHLAYEMDKVREAFVAFVDLLIAYTKGADQDLTTFKEALQGVNNDEETEHDEKVD